MVKKVKKPPWIAKFLLNRMKKYDREFVSLGDFEEEYNEIQQENGFLKAYLWYWIQVMGSLPSYLLVILYWSYEMSKNYLKITLRNIKKQKGFSFINISGLAVGMACCILIIMYINSEMSYDGYHKNADRIYRVVCKIASDELPKPIASTGPPLAPALKRELPEVKEAVRFYPVHYTAANVPVKYRSNLFFERDIFYTDDSVFRVFSFDLIKGDPETSLKKSYSLVITEDIAKKYFGKEDPLGKILTFFNNDNYTVTGVMKNVPENSHFTFDILCSMETLYEERWAQMESWKTAYDYYTYVLLGKNTEYKNVEKKLTSVVEKHMIDESTGIKLELLLQPLRSIHLHSDLSYEISVNGDITYIYIYATIAVFILLTACINFMNLSTARSTARAKEVGMRKVIGSDRGQLIKQFLGESLLYSVFSLIIALILARLTVPIYKNITGGNLFIGVSDIPWLIPSLIGLTALVGFAAGSYPAFFLSAFQPVRVLKGIYKRSKSGAGFRKILVVVQFSVSVFLITGTGIIMSQLAYMKNKKLGFDKEHIVIVPIGGSIIRSLETVKKELKTHSNIIDVSASRTVPGEQPATYYYHVENAPNTGNFKINEINVDFDFIPAMGLELVAGRNFSVDFPTDRQESVIINETAAKMFGWENPIGKTIGSYRSKKIIGVVKDFHLLSLHKKITPLVLNHIPGWYNSLSVRIKPENIPGTLKFIREKWNSIAPDFPFEYHFLDTSFDNQYKSDERLSKIFKYFAFLAIFIACLGLFGMASYMAEQRTKEIGIRKVLGAKTSGIVFLLNREIMKLIILANILALPFAYYALSRWLEGFYYRTNINILLFAGSAVLVLLIGFIAVSLQTLRAAVVNPVNSLRSE